MSLVNEALQKVRAEGARREPVPAATYHMTPRHSSSAMPWIVALSAVVLLAATAVVVTLVLTRTSTTPAVAPKPAPISKPTPVPEPDPVVIVAPPAPATQPAPVVSLPVPTPTPTPTPAAILTPAVPPILVATAPPPTTQPAQAALAPPTTQPAPQMQDTTAKVVMVSDPVINKPATTRPAETAAPTPAPAPEVASLDPRSIEVPGVGKLKLTGIAISPYGTRAVINNAIVSEGDQIGSVTVVEIQTKHVKLKVGDKTYMLTLP